MVHQAPNKRTGAPLERFMMSVSVDNGTGCWNWTGVVSKQGYGRFSYNGSQHQAHRVAYTLLVGDIPDNLPLDHLCRNRMCVNPKHLEPVTNRENILRGVSVTARNAKASHCKRGHPFDLTNTIWAKDGTRECMACKRALKFNWRNKQRGVHGSPESVFARPDLSATAKQVFGLLWYARAGSRTSAERLAQALNTSESAAEAALRELQDAGILTQPNRRSRSVDYGVLTPP